MIEHMDLRAEGAVGREATEAPFAQRNAARKRPTLDFQSRQGHLNPHVMKYQRLLARAGAPALSDLQSETGTRALLQPEHFEAQLPAAGNVGQRLERIFFGMKYAETLRKIHTFQSIDALNA